MAARPWLVLLALATPAAAQSAPADPIVLLGDRDYPPLSFLENGEPKGMDVEIARELERVLGREIEVELTDWDEAQRRVIKGEADGLFSMSISDQRRKLYDF